MPRQNKTDKTTGLKGSMYVTPKMMKWMGGNGRANLITELRKAYKEYAEVYSSSLASRPLEFLRERRAKHKRWTAQYDAEIARREGGGKT